MTEQIVLVPAPPDDFLLQACGRFRLLRLWEEADPDRYLADHGGEVVAVANPGHSPVPVSLLDRLPNLELIAHVGVGYDSVDIEAAVARGVLVANASGSNDNEVADTAMGLLLMAVRELGRAEQHLRAGRWESDGPYPLTDLSLRGRTIGLLGMGRIGQAIARRAEAFDMTVVYHTRTARDVPYRHLPTPSALARTADVLVVAVPGGATTHHLVNADVLTELGPDGVLINVARGSIVDEEALAAALADGTIHAAGLDVYENEPHVPEELLALDNAVLLPHVGSASVPTRRAMAELAAENLAAWFDRREVLTPVPECAGLLPGSE
ncbi:2-hydroxyacid dehydrogenase [Georgenia halophila]|uniref:2-hydroxyacid dehydrogenase n=1 Tax=Georgenia halophila TaxID=620889 RepID=A0ABP8LHD6_9MICO